MPGPLKSEKHERFVLGLMKGKTLVEAYVGAGYAANEKNAARLKKNEGVAERLAELQAEAADIAKVDAAWVLTKSVKLLENCEKEGDRANAKSVLKMIGDHVAVQAFRAQVGLGGPNGGPIQIEDLTHLSDEELETYGRLARKLAGDASGERRAV